ncbi:MAG TPA: PQQ-binding-like beta-propeller repeat protein [Urbifossiella sp.]|nr:PQQ-binding-like beta-propeller repeat protein [Urbifossiella sp.]
MSFRLLPLAAGVLAVATAALSAQPPAAPGPTDWPQWRGPNRDGKSAETGLLKSWPKDGPPLAWTASGLGDGFGTPTVVGGKIYVMGTADGKDGVHCLNEADGKAVWFAPITAPLVRNPNNGSGSQPTYSNGKLYAVAVNGTVAVVDAKTGKVGWTKSYDEFGAKPGSWGFNESVLVDGDKVICNPGGSKGAVVALNAKTGATVWATPINPVGGGAGYSSAVKMTVGGIPTYVCLLGDKAGVVGVHADNGKLLWQYNGLGVTGGTAQIPTPVILGNRVFVSCSYSEKAGAGAALLELTPEGKSKIDVKVVKAYRKPEANNHHGGMILVGKHVYFGHNQNAGIPANVDMTTGEVHKEDRSPPGTSGSAAITFADGRLYYRYENRVMALVEPDPTQFKMVSSFTLPPASNRMFAQSWPHPVVANGRLLIRDQDKVYAYSVKGETN